MGGDKVIVMRADRFRIAVREARRAVDRRAVAGWNASPPSFVSEGATVALSLPSSTDGAAWREARLALRAELEPWWPVRRSWELDHIEREWIVWCSAVRWAARRGLAHPFVLSVDGVLRGQVGVDAVDLGTRTGELSFWVDSARVPPGATLVALAQVTLRALTSPVRLERIAVPVAVTNPHPEAELRELGFSAEAVLSAYRTTRSGRTDHTMHVLHRDEETLSRLRSIAVGSSVGQRRVNKEGPSARTQASIMRARLAVRVTQDTGRSNRVVPGWDQPTAEVLSAAGRRLRLRLPELDDGPAWRDARLRSRKQLEPWWPTADDWAAHQNLTSWTEQVRNLRRAARRGLALPGVAESDGRFAGQVGVDAIDVKTRTGELSVWLDSALRGGTNAHVLVALLALRAFTGPLALERLVAPVAVGNRVAAAAARSFGFSEEGTLRLYRETSLGRTDHRIFALVKSPAEIERLQARLAKLTYDGDSHPSKP